MLKSRLLIAVVASVAASSGAAADGTDSWSGVYVGAHGAYTWADIGLFLQPDGVQPREDLGKFAAKGWLGGVHLGLNKEIGPLPLGGLLGGDPIGGTLVVGGELSVSGGGVDGTTPCEPENVASTCEASLDWLALGIGRIGYAYDDVMLYATGGVAIAGITADFISAFRPPGNAGGSVTTVGFAFGGGGEVDLGNGVLLGLEYLRLEFNERRTHSVDDVYESFGSDLDNADLLRARLSLKWGGED